MSGDAHSARVMVEGFKMHFIVVGDCGADGRAVGGAPGSERWIGKLLQPPIDRRFARSEWRRALKLHGEVSEERTELRGCALYQEVVRRCLGRHPEPATGIVQRADDSFATRPAARDVRFRDVVTYIVIHDFIRQGNGCSTTMSVQDVVSRVIPAQL